MIILEITTASDIDMIGIYTFHFPEVFVGRSKKNDLIYTEKEMPLKYFSLRFKSSSLIIQSQPNTPFYFVNGKKMSGTRKLSIGDKIQFGPNSILIRKILAPFDKSDDLAHLYAEFNKVAPEQKFILDFLEERILELEKNNV